MMTMDEVRADVAESWRRGLESMVRGMVRGMAKLAEEFHRWSLLYPRTSRHRRARCRTCNPRGNPLPLAVDGAAYRRRQRARRKR